MPVIRDVLEVETDTGIHAPLLVEIAVEGARVVRIDIGAVAELNAAAKLHT